jgi:hypothetical protein
MNEQTTPCADDPGRAQLAEALLGDIAARYGLEPGVVLNPGQLAGAERAKVQDARCEVWAEWRELGYHFKTIGAHFGISAQAVQQGIKRYDDGGVDVALAVKLIAPARMLPQRGPRLDCANEGSCLAELWKACGRVEPPGASCPARCPAFEPSDHARELEQRSRAEPAW